MMALFILGVGCNVPKANSDTVFVYQPSSNIIEQVDAQYRPLVRLSVPSGVPNGVVQTSGKLVVRFTGGLLVFSKDGTLIKWLIRQNQPGAVAALRPGWVVATSAFTDLSAYSIDGTKRLKIDTTPLMPGLHSLSNDRFALTAGRELHIYGGWPPRLLHTHRFPDIISQIDAMGNDTALVATTPDTDTRFDDRSTLYLVDLRNWKVRLRRLLPDPGLVTSLRRIGGSVAVAINVCDPERSGSVIRFLKPDLSESSIAPLTLSGWSVFAALGSHLAIAERDCRTRDDAMVLDYDPSSGKVRKTMDGPYIVFGKDGP